MQSKPQVLSWQICDAVHIDPSTGKHYLMGCFSAIRAKEFPTKHSRMVWFITLTDVPVGKHVLKFQMGPELESTNQIGERPFESPNPASKINLVNGTLQD